MGDVPGVELGRKIGAGVAVFPGSVVALETVGEETVCQPGPSVGRDVFVIDGVTVGQRVSWGVRVTKGVFVTKKNFLGVWVGVRTGCSVSV